MPLDDARASCVDSTTGLAGQDRERSRKSAAGESDMLQAYSAPPEGRTVSFGRAAAMDRVYLKAPLLPRAALGARAVGERAERGERKGGRAKEGGLAGTRIPRDMYATVPELEEEVDGEAKVESESEETPQWGQRDTPGAR